MSGMDVHYSSKTSEWETPDGLFSALDARFRFTLDPCCTHENAKCERHYTIQEDGLSQDWQGETVFCNPPYGRALQSWVEKCRRESEKPGTVVVALLPARTDTRWFHDIILPSAEILFIRGRIRFGGSRWNAPFPSMVCIFPRSAVRSFTYTLEGEGRLATFFR